MRGRPASGDFEGDAEVGEPFCRLGDAGDGGLSATVVADAAELRVRLLLRRVATLVSVFVLGGEPVEDNREVVRFVRVLDGRRFGMRRVADALEELLVRLL